ncbi:hypothetical protein J3D54_001759 [Pseudomonas sp. GGS8]|uniref:hypothetical protein n=1 Tax=Pseudomonas sp. GGS8 TaxID=2817892 RepID=UPI0020A1D75C|nr:hypothetical protein [Pseudomonas sp. GGS8]MCP1442627.1 hypothetical protein [Pseudomonas sp. GGS8]
MAFQPEKALVEFFYQQYALQGSGKLMLGSVTGMLNMLPQYPVRGTAYCALAGGLTVFAILLTRAIDSYVPIIARKGGGSSMKLRSCMTSVLAAGCLLLTGCTTQLVYFNEIYLVNTCGVPLEVEPHHYTNWLPPIAPRLVAPGEQVSVASYKSFGEDVDQQVSCRYSLTVKGAQRTRLISADEMRYALLSIKRERDGSRRSWTLKDGVFCP